jgi:hypothetical protein
MFLNHRGVSMKLAWLAFWMGLTVWTASSAGADDYWKFKHIHGQPLEARVSRYEVDQQQVTLVARDGVEVKVSIAELDTADKRLLVRALERSLSRKPKPAAVLAPPREIRPQDSAARAAGAKTVGPRDAQPTSSIALGPTRPLVWHTSFKQAAAEAGTESTGRADLQAREADTADPQNSPAAVADTQRPIVWFRVLGDLRGLM